LHDRRTKCVVIDKMIGAAYTMIGLAEADRND